MFGESQNTLAELVLCHHCAQVAHGLAVFLRVCDRREWVQAAIVLRERLDIRPRLVIFVVFRHLLLPGGRRLCEKSGIYWVQESVWREQKSCDSIADEVEGRHGGVRQLHITTALGGNAAAFYHSRTIVNIFTVPKSLRIACLHKVSLFLTSFSPNGDRLIIKKGTPGTALTVYLGCMHQTNRH